MLRMEIHFKLSQSKNLLTELLRYCITWVSKTSCRIKVSVGIEWFKAPFVKGIIKSTYFKTFSEIMEQYMQEIEGHGKKKKGKSLSVAKKKVKNDDVPRINVLRKYQNYIFYCIGFLFLFFFAGHYLWRPSARKDTVGEIYHPFEDLDHVKYGGFMNMTRKLRVKSDNYVKKLEEAKEIQRLTYKVHSVISYLEKLRAKDTLAGNQDELERLLEEIKSL